MSESALQALHEAEHHTKNNEPDLAEQAYRRVLEKYPENQWALAGLAALRPTSNMVIQTEVNTPTDQIGELKALYAQGKLHEALISGKALAIRFPGVPFIHLLLGAVYDRMQRQDLATACYLTVISIDPESAVAHCNLGNSLRILGKKNEAIKSFDSALRIKPDYAKACEGLGMTLEASGQHEEALTQYDNALLLNPNSAFAYIRRGNALKALARFEEAARSFDHALQISPNNTDAYSSLGNTLNQMDKPEEAIIAYSRALEINPNLPQVHNNLGNTLKNLGKHDEAIVSYNNALKISPKFTTAYFNLGNTLSSLSRHDQAIDAYESALQIDPNHLETLRGLGASLIKTGKAKEAIASFQKALLLDPDHLPTRDRFLCALPYDPNEDYDAHLKDQFKWWRNYENDVSGHDSTSIAKPRTDQRLKIGLVSPNFGTHPVGFLAIDLLENAGHLDLDFYCYSDRSNPDEYTRRFEKSAHRWRNIHGDSDTEVISKIQRDRIDILFDLTGHFANNRLPVFARKPAPVQVAWLSYGTRGLPAIDYILADRFHIPETHEDQYSETVIRLPEGYSCFDPPPWPLAVSSLPALKNGFVTFGCFNNPKKINDAVLEKWAVILTSLPASELILKYIGFDAEVNKKRVLSVFERRGIDRSRLSFEGQSPRRELLERYRDIDIALDTWPYSGGVTTCEALWMGVPVVTLPGRTFSGRHSFSHLSNVGFTDSVASNLDNYVETAVMLASDTQSLAQIRSELREKMLESPLCDGRRFAVDFADLMQDIWSKYVGEAKPDVVSP